MKTETVKKTIVAIDDERGPRESLRMVLKDEYNILIAHNGEEGLKEIKENEVDLVILDIRMPGLNGVEVLRRIKKIDDRIEVILLTGYGSLVSAREAVRFGAFDYLSKPFRVNHLKKVVSEALKKRDGKLRAEEYVRELKALNAALKRELEEASELVITGRLSAAMLHEIKNPMAGILGYSELLLEEVNNRKAAGEGLPEYFEHYLTIIRRETERCGRMTRKFFNFSRLRIEDLQDTDVNQLLTEVVEILDYQARLKNIALSTQLSRAISGIICQPDLIKQVFINLALNALEALPEGGELKIISEWQNWGDTNAPETDHFDWWIRVTFQDNGPGISPEDQKQLLGEDQNNKNGGEKGRGWGITISRQIIEKHEGKLTLNSRKGKGTMVSVLLPAVQNVEKNLKAV